MFGNLFTALSLILVMSGFMPVVMSCTMADWSKTFKKWGWSNCRNKANYINGFYRVGGSHIIDRIEKARCCGRTRPYWNQPTQCVIADWYHSFDSNYRWNTCPDGHFLQSMYRSDGTGDGLHNIDYGKCCKPASHPYWYGQCYDQDTSRSFDKQGTIKCRDGYYVTGFYRGGCNNLKCIDKLRCCKMYPSPPALTSLSDVKTRVMDVTLDDLAYLAHDLGYGWCGGCRGQWIGEDFVRSADSWHANKLRHCSGYKSGHRLKLHYENFKFGIQDIRYGKPVIQTLKATVFDSGKVINDDVSPLLHKVERELRSVRTVTHTTTSSWKQSHELGIELSYTPGSTGGWGGKVSYKFNYEKSSTTSDSTAKQQYKSIKVVSQKTLPPKTAASYRIMLTKTRSTIPYTATIIAHFSAKLDGFLRWGGGYNGKSTNYHVKHRGSGGRPTVPHSFGDDKKPFYIALKEQSDRNVRPWQWHNMKQKYSYAKTLLANLCDEKRYEFTLTGKFEDVVGQHAEVQWKSSGVGGTMKRSSIDDPSSANNTFTGEEDYPESPVEVEDPPEIFPKPPVVVIKPNEYEAPNDKEEKALG